MRRSNIKFVPISSTKMRSGGIIILIIGLLACNEIEQCQLDPNRKGFTMAFYRAVDSTAYDSISFVAISPGVLNDSTGTFFPLDPLEESVAYLFQTDSNDYTLNLSYRVSHYLYAEDCDPSIRFSDLRLLETSFDSVAVIGTVLDRNIPINVEVYF